MKALERVIDPELRKPVTELDMVRAVDIDGGDVRVTIALTIAGCPLRDSFQQQVAEVLAEGSTAPTINVSYVERWNGSQRHFNARKARKVYTFSKDWVFHVAVTWLVVTAYNWCWTPRTLREPVQGEPGHYQQRTPAMVAGLAAAPCTLAQVLACPVYRDQSKSKTKRKSRRRQPKRTEGR